MQCPLCWKDGFECHCLPNGGSTLPVVVATQWTLEEFPSKEVASESFFSKFPGAAQSFPCGVQDVSLSPFWNIQTPLYEFPIWNPYEVSEGIQQERHPSLHGYLYPIL